MGMKSPAVGIKDLLVSAGVGTFATETGWSISVGVLPTAPDTAIACVDSPGQSPYSNIPINFPAVQCLIRGVAGGYVAAHDKGRAVIDALLGIPDQTVNGDAWAGITEIGDLAFIGMDEKHRPMFSANFSIIVEPASVGYRTGP